MNDIDLYWAAQRIKLEAVFIFGFQAQDLSGRLVSHELAMSLLTRTVDRATHWQTVRAS